MSTRRELGGITETYNRIHTHTHTHTHTHQEYSNNAINQSVIIATLASESDTTHVVTDALHQYTAAS